MTFGYNSVVKENIQIIPVSAETIDPALNLIHQIFPHTTPEEDPDLWFKMSIDPEKYTDKIRENGCRDVRYFVALNKETNQVIGTTGLYHLNKDLPGTVWLGWFCVDPNFRRKGIGRYMLGWTIDKAKSEGESTLKLYTSPKESPEAQILYDKFGFISIGEDLKDGSPVTYKELQIKN